MNSHLSSWCGWNCNIPSKELYFLQSYKVLMFYILHAGSKPITTTKNRNDAILLEILISKCRIQRAGFRGLGCLNPIFKVSIFKVSKWHQVSKVSIFKVSHHSKCHRAQKLYWSPPVNLKSRMVLYRRFWRASTRSLFSTFPHKRLLWTSDTLFSNHGGVSEGTVYPLKNVSEGTVYPLKNMNGGTVQLLGELDLIISKLQIESNYFIWFVCLYVTAYWGHSFWLIVIKCGMEFLQVTEKDKGWSWLPIIGFNHNK